MTEHEDTGVLDDTPSSQPLGDEVSDHWLRNLLTLIFVLIWVIAVSASFVLFIFVVEWIASTLGLAGHIFGAIMYGFTVALYALAIPLILQTIREKVSDGEVAYEATLGAVSRLIYGNFINIIFIVSTLCIVFTCSIAFWQMCRHLFFLFGGFASPHTDYWSWALFAVSQVVDTALFNAPQVLGWNVPSITATALWSQILVIVFNILLAAGFLTLVIQAFLQIRLPRLRRRNQTLARETPSL